MKEIRILKLTLDHFKGMDHFVLKPDGGNAAVYGDNATGKTTLYDGLTWLLFGKDSAGRTDFALKPLGEDGEVLDHQAVTSVEAELDVSGTLVSLRKCYYEKWTTKRGSAVETFDGHTTDYYVDGVPCKKYEYDRRVADLVDEELFRTLTSVTWFCAGLDWKKRRAALFELGQVEDDGQIMASEPRFAPLAEAMGTLSLEDFKKKVQAERKGYTGVRNDLPTRLDECQKTVDEISGTDFEALRRERDARKEKLDALSADLVKLDNDTYLTSRRNDRDRLKNELTALEQENAAFRREQEVPLPDVGALSRELEDLKRSLLRKTEARRKDLKAAEQAESEVERCRTRWKQVNARRFTGADCPVCGRPLEGGKLDEARARFEQEKQAELGDLVRDSDMLKGRAADYRRYADASADEAVELENRIAALNDRLDGARAVTQPKISDLPGYETKRNRYLCEIRDLEELIDRHAADGAAIREETTAKLRALQEEIDAISGALAKEDVLAFTRERMDRLRAEAAEAGQKLEKLDKLLYLCEDFVRYKVSRIERDINGHFSLVQWKLFDEQINGGLSECCEATVDGVPYQSLNSGMRINAGIDVIATLSEHAGVRVPLVVDNAETVTALRPLASQVIRLVVSEQDKELRCETWG